MTPGHKLRCLRERLALSIRDVETASARLAAKYANGDFAIPLSRLSEIETKSVVPNVFKLYSLAVIYRRSFAELLALYDVHVENTPADAGVVELAKTHKITCWHNAGQLQVPIQLDPGFDLQRTCNLGRMIERWGVLPMALLEQLAGSSFTYGYVGLSDLTMYPLVLPGSFIQVDETRNRVVEKMWRSEYERPIYFVETREEYLCCWCSLDGDRLIAQPHPLSPVAPRVFKAGLQAEVLGQIVGIAMRLDQWSPAPASVSRDSKLRQAG